MRFEFFEDRRLMGPTKPDQSAPTSAGGSTDTWDVAEQAALQAYLQGGGDRAKFEKDWAQFRRTKGAKAAGDIPAAEIQQRFDVFQKNAAADIATRQGGEDKRQGVVAAAQQAENQSRIQLNTQARSGEVGALSGLSGIGVYLTKLICPALRYCGFNDIASGLENWAKDRITDSRNFAAGDLGNFGADAAPLRSQYDGDAASRVNGARLEATVTQADRSARSGGAGSPASSTPAGKTLADFSDEQLNVKFARARSSHVIAAAQYDAIDTNHDHKISKQEVARAPADITRRVLPELSLANGPT